MCTACGVTRASLVRARAARALSGAAESRRAVAHVPGVRMYCTGCGAVREASVSSCILFVVLWPGHCGVSRGRTVASHPQGVDHPQSPHRPLWTDLLGTRAERVPDCSSYLSRIPRSATDSGSSIHPRDSVDRAAWAEAPIDARLHALLNASAASESTAAGSLKAASSNASAASESTTAGGLEAFSQGSAGAERFENASSKFRWNPSPPRPSTIAPVRGERPDVGHSSP